jgi:anti-sigma regulatory factor (Ser/Thr protein kinase)
MLDPLAPDGAALLTLAFPLGRATPRAHNGEPPSWKVSWSFDSTAAAANSVRRAFLACLSSKDSGGKAIDLAAAELIFGELLGNVVRHAPGPVDIALDWTGDLPVLHVLDSGPGFRSRRNRERLPVDDLSESGRGLFIVNACAKQFTVRNRNGRGTHATATLPAS